MERWKTGKPQLRAKINKEENAKEERARERREMGGMMWQPNVDFRGCMWDCVR